jgi:hypothetical protein
MDEHQKLFEPINTRIDPKIRFVDDPYFRAYKEWTSSTSGVNTITIYSGSANSKFQFHLPSGEERKIRFIIPPTEREFKTIISDKNSTLKFPRQDQINKLEIATGRNFREISHYIQVCNSNYDEYLIAAKENMTTRLNAFLSQTTECESKQFTENLDKLFGLRFYGKEPSFSGAFYDRGLIYKEKHGGLIKFLNLPAKDVLLRYFLDHFKMEKISSWDGPDLQGKFLEKYCVNSDLASCISIELDRSGSPSLPKTSMKYEVDGLDYMENLQIGEGSKYVKTTLLWTTQKLFPYIDYVIYNPETKSVIFKQISMSTITKHLKKDSEQFQEKFPGLEGVSEVIKFLFYEIYAWDHGYRLCEKGTGKSMCQLILQLLFGKIEHYQAKIENGMFKVFDGQKAFDIEIVYVTGTKREENTRQLQALPLKNLVCCFREDLERLKIPF